MSNNAAGKSRVLPGAFCTMLIAVFGFTSCGGGGGGGGGASSATATPVSIFVSSTSIPYNSSIDISWSSTNSTSCVSTGGGGTSATGTFNTGPLTTTTSYTVTCGTASQSVTITVGSQAVAAAITGFANAGGGNVTVTAANSSLANGDTITIYGTTNYNGTYTVANRTATSFTIVATFVSNDATGVWQRAGGTISGCTTTGATGNISLSNVPARFTGVAPLSVFFDASASTATATTRPFHDLEYRWNFGEDPAVLATLPGGANWIYGSTDGSRNLATGPVAAHVFETPGLYTVNLTATDGTNSVTNSCAQIAVQYPDALFAGTKTTCFSTTGTFSGCPTGATHVTTSNFVTAISTYQATGKRLLFRRGDTFAASTYATINTTGPGMIGAYGTGSAPKILATGNTTIINLNDKSHPGISDWRVMDLELDGMSGNISGGVGSGGGINQVTLLRLNIHDTHNGVGLVSSILDYNNTTAYSGHTIWDQFALVDSAILNTMGGSGGNAVGLSIARLSMLGNIVDDSTATEHVVRIFSLNKGVIGNNTLSRPAIGKHALKLHAASWCSASSPIGTCTVTPVDYTTDTQPLGVAGPYTEQVVISDNKFVASDNTDWTVTVGPQNSSYDERLRNIIIERNWFVSGSGTSVSLYINAADVTVRNNICNATSSSGQTCVSIGPRGTEPPPNNVSVLNNTIYGTTSASFSGITVAATSINTTVYNNLGSAPLATSPVMVRNNGTGTVQGNNLLNNSPATLFVSPTPVAPVDFRLNSISPARDFTPTIPIPVFSDFFLTSRPQSGAIDLGAVEEP